MNKHVHWLLAGWFAVLVWQTEAEAQWQRFRGPNGSGVVEATGLPEVLDPSANVDWRVDMPPGHSSPVVFEQRIYLTALDDSLVTLCLDLKSGAEIWRVPAPEVDTPTIDPRNHPASPSVAVDQSGVYSFFPDYGLIAHSLDGEVKWKKEIGPFNNLYGMGASPILVEDLLVLAIDQSTDSYIAAFDTTSGDERWKTARPEAKSGHCTPIVVSADDGASTILLPGSFFLTAYDAADGRKLWWVGGLSFEMKSTPVMHDGLIFANGYGSPFNNPGQEVELAPFAEMIERLDADDDEMLALEELEDRLHRGFFPAFDLNGDGKLHDEEWAYFQAAMRSKNSMMGIQIGGGQGDLTEDNVMWQYHRNVPQLPSPVVYRDRLYMIDDGGVATCFNPQTGEVLDRSRLEGAEGSYYASPVAGDDKIYFISLDGKTATLSTDGTLQPIANGDLGESCYATPAIVGDQILVRTEQSLFCFRASDD